MAVVEELERILLPSKMKRNIPVYKKLGYKHIWEDDSATNNYIVCMKKKFGGGLFGLFG